MQKIINRYKRIRTERYLRQVCQQDYAFVGMGQHSLTNLYPVLHYLNVPLKYICVTSKDKARLIERRWDGVIATTQIEEILLDPSVKGVFVSAAPKAHFQIAARVLQSGKSLFIEKPPCQSSQELQGLIEMQRINGTKAVVVGLNQRYAPAVQMLKKRIRDDRPLNYDIHYLTGAYPEGDPLLDLFIHPLDLVVWLFGKCDIESFVEINGGTYVLMLKHKNVVGTIELSTCHSWHNAHQSLTVRAAKGSYYLNQADELSFIPKAPSIMGLPLEKLGRFRQVTEQLYRHDGFSPILQNNNVYTQGYYQEIKAFVAAVEGRAFRNLTNLQSIEPTYQLLEAIREHNNTR